MTRRKIAGLNALIIPPKGHFVNPSIVTLFDTHCESNVNSTRADRSACPPNASPKEKMDFLHKSRCNSMDFMLYCTRTPSVGELSKRTVLPYEINP